MSKEELISRIKDLKIVSVSLDILLNLEYNDLYLIYMTNRNLKYYDGLKKQQMIYAITMVNKEYCNVSLWQMGYEEIIKIYLSVFNLTPAQFKEKIVTSVENFKAEAKENNDEDYMDFSSDEMIIASGVLMPDPEFIKELHDSALEKDNEPIVDNGAVAEEIEKLEKELAWWHQMLDRDNERLNDCASFEEAEVYGDITHDENQISKIEDQLAVLKAEEAKSIKR